MEKIRFVVLLMFTFSSQIFAQGSLDFGNVYGFGSAPVTINTIPGAFNPANGPAGAFVGSDYTASLYFLNGTITDQAVFDNSNPVWFAPADTFFSEPQA